MTRSSFTTKLPLFNVTRVSESISKKGKDTMFKYITYEERLEIENRLTRNESLRKIGNAIGRNRTSVSREIQRYVQSEKYSRFGSVYNPCLHRSKCKKQNVCGDSCTRRTVKYCRNCGICCDKCEDFEEEICMDRFKSPFVCNGCESRYSCTLEKSVYSAKYAQQAAEFKRKESKSGFILTEEDIIRLNNILVPLINKGQSLHQIYVNNADKIMCSEKTLYNYIDAGILEVRNIDLPRKVRYRPRKKKKEFKVDRNCYLTRTYLDYQKYLSSHPDAHTVQIDSVMGSHGGKTLLTMHFVECSLMIAFLREANTSRSVTAVFEYLYNKLDRDLFMRLFPVILTDRGSEFSNPLAIEFGRNLDDVLRTKVFYCDPNSPFQKGSLEVNHELIRRVIPKGRTLDNLTQEKVDMMMNHINSYSRKKLGNKTPYEVFKFIYGDEAIDKLNLKEIKSNDILLHPRLLQD